MASIMGLNLGSSSLSSASNFARTYGSEASQRSEAAAATANGINAQTMQMIMDFNHNEALLQREWEEQMSNTAYQRAITDMKAAKINPILAALNGGASTPSGASASGQALNAAMANTYADQIGGGSSYSETWDNMAKAFEGIGRAIGSALNIEAISNTAQNYSNWMDGVVGNHFGDGTVSRPIHQFFKNAGKRIAQTPNYYEHQ